MSTECVETQLVAYLSLREALGFQMRAETILLPEFVAFVKAHDDERFQPWSAYPSMTVIDILNARTYR